MLSEKKHSIENLDNEKISVLLNLLDYQTGELQHKDEQGQKWFEWTTSLLLAAFGAIVALSNRSTPIPQPIVVKSLATVLVSLPTFLFISRILSRPRGAATNAKTIVRIQKLLFVFDEKCYGEHSPYPKEWSNDYLEKLVHKHRTSTTQILVLLLLVSCVITAIWIIL